MVESSVLGTSPWNSDPFLCKDFNPFPGLLDDGLNETEIGNSESLPFFNDAVIPLEDDPLDRVNQDFLWSGHDYLTTSTVSPISVSANLQIQDSNCATEDSLGFEALGWTVEDSSWQSDSSSEIPAASSLTSSHQSPRKKTRTQNPLSPSKSWSRMNGEEQLGTVEALTQIISHQMGLREQLEVIQIIDPKAVISAADTEFVIDLGCLNDVKLQRIREYVTSHAQELGSHQDSVSSRMGSGQSNRSSSSSSSSSVPSSLRSDTGSSSSSSGSISGKPSKKQLREQHKQWKAWRQRQRKEQRQTLKERRSGLFVKNEILWLNAAEEASDANDHDLEEDIDILA